MNGYINDSKNQYIKKKFFGSLSMTTKHTSVVFDGQCLPYATTDKYILK